MFKKLTPILVLLFSGFLFIVGTSVVKAQSICVRGELFKVRPADALKKKLSDRDFDISSLEEKLLERIEDYFIDNRVTVKACQEKYDFQLKGTVEVQDMMEGTRGFLIVFSTDSIRIVPSKSKKFLPTMTFKDISGEKHPGWNSSHSTDPLTAVRNGLDCFLGQMQEKGVFDFHKHPLIREAIAINKKKLEELEKNRVDMVKAFAQMIEDANADMKKTVKVEIQDAIPGLAEQLKQEYRKGQAVILKRMEQLENRVKNQKSIDKKDIEEFKTLVGQFNSKLGTIREDYKLVNYVIVYVELPANIPAVFKRTYIKPETCNNCSETEIEAKNIMKMSSPADIELLDQNAEYGYPLDLDGEMSNNNGIITITLAEESYNKIFKLDSDGNSRIVDSIKDIKIHYPRIFIMDRKHRK
jgi:transcription elongation GreA/GreB family factor